MNVIFRKALLLAVAFPTLSAIAAQENSNSTTEVMDVYGTSYNRAIDVDKPGETVITREKIEIEQPTNIAELFEDIPGVSFDGGARGWW
ncbi:hypothetical protein JCM19235_6144 [Vibrio maritimus]|uniref:TonB-dependent receptor n=1 Tax=Vibrio maritimus TaxID=990268 RepID=A0A090RQP9_9VIBR|nr:hypothetical protein JCM19235_6144 [Vibrio maritimus]